MLGKTTLWFKGLSFVGKSAALAATSIVTVGVVGAATVPSQPSTSNLQNTSTSVKKDVSEVKLETTTKAVPFASSTVEDGSVAIGTTQTKTIGISGTETSVWSVTYTNGSVTDRVLKSKAITQQPVNEVITKGTYVTPSYSSCPSGTYVNSAGNTVCSPYSSPSAPSGASARCADGTYSFSQSRRGTCSHHGGVSSWL